MQIFEYRLGMFQALPFGGCEYLNNYLEIVLGTQAGSENSFFVDVSLEKTVALDKFYGISHYGQNPKTLTKSLSLFL